MDPDIDEIHDSVHIHNFHRFIIYPIVDMLTALGLLYLFYALEMKRKISIQKEKKKAVVVRGGGNDEDPKMIDFRMNHGTKHLKEILRHTGTTD